MKCTSVDETLRLVQPLPDLTKLAGQTSIQQPLPVANLKMCYTILEGTAIQRNTYPYFLSTNVEIISDVENL